MIRFLTDRESPQIQCLCWFAGFDVGIAPSLLLKYINMYNPGLVSVIIDALVYSVFISIFPKIPAICRNCFRSA